MAVVPVIDPEWPTMLQDEMVLNGGIPAASDLRAWEAAVRYLAAYPWVKPASCVGDADGSFMALAGQPGSLLSPSSVEFGVQMHPWATALEVHILGAPAIMSSVSTDRMSVSLTVSGATGITLGYDTTLTTASIEHASWQSGVITGIGGGEATDEDTVRVVLTNDSGVSISAVVFWLFAIQFRQSVAPAISQ